MFGLEKKQSGLAFDLETELKGPKGSEKASELKKLIAARKEALKTALRRGEDKKEFEKAEILLHGYNALEQVLEKVKK